MRDDFATALADVCSGWQALRPPSRVAVSDGIAAAMKIARPGGESKYWSAAETPYMVDPANHLSNRRYSAVVFVGPAQSGKTVALVDGWLAYVVVHDPGDMLIVQMTQDKAREFSKQRVDRMFRNSPKLREFRGLSSRDDNLHDKQFRHGMWLRIVWPTPTNFASTSYRYVAITDYDRIADDIEGEGDAFTLARKRITTYQSRGRVVVESSPGRLIRDPNWRPATLHEAPPVGGILGLYNKGDRRRFYWTCRHCRGLFEAAPGLGLFQLPPEEQLLTDIRRIDLVKMARQYARIVCPLCTKQIGFEHRGAMNLAGRWFRDEDDSRESDIASFWLGGIAATYISWEELLLKYLQAMLGYALTGKEQDLQSTVNVDQGAPYISRALVETSSAGNPADRRTSSLTKRVVPAWARLLIATVDVQGGQHARFVVQVHAIGPQLQWAPIDRYNISVSRREGPGGFLNVDPAGYVEDWDLITDKVTRCTYPIEDSELELRPYLVLVDTGGEGKRRQYGQIAKVHEGVTANAYAWWRRLRSFGAHRSVVLLKGEGGRHDWMVKRTMVGSKDAVRDVPLLLLNTNALKDVVAAAARRDSGPGALLFPGWLSEAWFDEFSAEVRKEDGTWDQVRPHNESFDLCQYTVAGWIYLGMDKWMPEKWERAPEWARPLSQGNTGTLTPDARREMRANDLLAGPRSAAPPKPVEVPARRVVRSSYFSN